MMELNDWFVNDMMVLPAPLPGQNLDQLEAYRQQYIEWKLATKNENCPFSLYMESYELKTLEDPAP